VTVSGSTPNATVTVSPGAVTITNNSTAVSGFTNGDVLTNNGSVVTQSSPTITVNGTNCTLGASCSPTNPTSANIPNASGSAAFTAGSISATSHTLTLSAAQDFTNGQGIRINHAGAAFTLNPPTGGTVTPLGAAGSTTYQYKIASVDAAGGIGAVTASFQTTVAPATLSNQNANLLNWTAPASGTPPTAYAIYKNISGTYTLVGLADSLLEWADEGLTGFPFCDWLPATAPASPLADALTTTISAGGGTTSLTLAAAATTTASNQGVYHDDSAAIQAALNVSGVHQVTAPTGTFYVDTNSNIPTGVQFSGQRYGTTFKTVFPNQSAFSIGGNAFLNGAFSDAIFQLVPDSKAVNLVSPANARVNDIWCQGGSTGWVATPACVYTTGGGADITIAHLIMDGWGGAVSNLAIPTGGDVPTITMDGTGEVLGINISDVIMTNDSSVGTLSTYIAFNDCFNCNLSTAVLNANFGASGSDIFGTAGVGVINGSQAVHISNIQTLGFDTNIVMGGTGSAPLQMDVTGSHFDFCGTDCINLSTGSWVTITGNTFDGEGNSPWLLVGNHGIHTSGSFTAGPNTITGNAIKDFSGSGSSAIQFTSAMNDTIVGANAMTSNATDVSGGTGGTGSAIGQNCSGSPTGSFSSRNGIVGHC
jgi:hypothetical protein